MQHVRTKLAGYLDDAITGERALKRRVQVRQHLGARKAGLLAEASKLSRQSLHAPGAGEPGRALQRALRRLCIIEIARQLVRTVLHFIGHPCRGICRGNHFWRPQSGRRFW